MRLKHEKSADTLDRTDPDGAAATRAAETQAACCQDMILITESAAATEKLGFQLAGLLVAGSVMSLEGDLGAGKTWFTRGLAAGLRCRGAVASPTFTIMMEHPAGDAGLPLYHFDVYRLLNSDEFMELGFDEYLDGEGVSVIEWGDMIQDILPTRTIRLKLEWVEHARQSRKITVCWPDGNACLAVLARLADAFIVPFDDRPEARGSQSC